MGFFSAEGRRPRSAFAAVLGGAVLALSGCVTSGYTYVANDDLGTYFKVPDDYTVFDSEQVMEQATEDLQVDVAEGLAADQWAVAFDANADPQIDAFLEQLSAPSDQLTGYARVRNLPPEQRFTYALESLRTELLPEAQFERLGEDLQILSVEELSQDGGDGLRVVFSIDTGDRGLVIDQLGLVDHQTRRVHLLALGCSAECYEASRDEIATIVESWTIEER